MAKFKCPACGEIVLEGIKRCSHCGYPLEYAFQNNYNSEVDNREEGISSLYEQREIEYQTGKFNWGAFLLAPFWGFANGMPWLFIIYLAIGLINILAILAINAISFTDFMIAPVFAITSIIYLVFSIYMGIAGGRLAWNKKVWNGITHFINVQKSWAIWGFVILAASFILPFILGLIGVYYFDNLLPSI